MLRVSARTVSSLVLRTAPVLRARRGVLDLKRGLASLVSSQLHTGPLGRRGGFVLIKFGDGRRQYSVDEKAIAARPPADAALENSSRWLRFKKWAVKEAKHYWHGTKLLAFETKISFRLISKMLGGTALTRREKQHLTKTAADMIRLIPFIVIVIVPFMELLLPVLLVLFPNMLPSTFESHMQKEEKKLKSLKVKVEMAKFLQASIEEMMLAEKRESIDPKGLLDKIKRGEDISNDEIVMIASTIGDKFTLETVPRPQLISMCKYMGISHYGSNNYLKSQLERKLDQIRADDEAIETEGVASLSLEELETACAARGMASSGLPRWQLERNLKRWLELSLGKHISPALLILSRAFLITAKASPEEAVKETLASLPPEMLAAAAQQAKDEKTLESLRKEDALVKAVAAKVTQEKKEEARDLAAAPAAEKAERVEEQPEKLDSLADAVDILSRPGAAEERALRALASDSEKMQKEAGQSKTSAKSVTTLRKLLQNLEVELQQTEETIAPRLKMIDIDGDGIITEQELQTAATQLKQRLTPEEMAVLWEELEGEQGKRIKVANLVSALRRKAAQSEEVLERAAVDKVKESPPPPKPISAVAAPSIAVGAMPVMAPMPAMSSGTALSSSATPGSSTSSSHQPPAEKPAAAKPKS